MQEHQYEEEQGDWEPIDDDLPLTRIARLSPALREEAASLSFVDARSLVDAYYGFQKPRVAMRNRLSAAERGEDNPPSVVLTRLHSHVKSFEHHMRGLLQAFAEARPVGQWMLSLYGVGPVLSAGMLAQFDIRKARRPSAFTRFAGMDPSEVWLSPADTKALVKETLGRVSGEASEDDIGLVAKAFNRRPENVTRLFAILGRDEPLPLTVPALIKIVSTRPHKRAAKVLCWNFADCAVKFSGREECYYGQRWADFKQNEVAMNASGKFAEQALAIAKKTPNHKQVAIYKEGRLPDGHVHARSCRLVIKVFLIHLWQVWWELEYGVKPPIGSLDIDGEGTTPEDWAGPPPNWPM